MRCVDKRLLKAESDRAGPLVQVLFNGFPVALFRDLYLLTEGTGTTLNNAIVGGAASALAAGYDGTSTSAWLAGGGVSLVKSAQFKMPARNATSPWQIIAGMSIDAPTALSGLAIVPIFGIGSFATSNQQRGAVEHVRFLSLSDMATSAELRVNNGGSANSPVTTASDVAFAINRLLVFSLRHDGAGNLTMEGFSGAGDLIFTKSLAVNLTAMITDTTGGAVASLQPVIGFDYRIGTGSKKVEWAGDLVGGSASFDDIQTICRAATALGAARGRPLT